MTKRCARPHKAGHVKCTRPKGHYRRHEAHHESSRSWFQWGGNRRLRGTMTRFNQYDDHITQVGAPCD